MSAEASFHALIDRVRTRTSTRVHGLEGLGLAHLALALSSTRPVVLVARSRTAADDFLRDLRFLSGPERAGEILHLPADDRAPYQAASPDPLVVMERSATLYKLATGAPFSVVVMSPAAVARRGVPFAGYQAAAELIVPDGELPRDPFIARLVENGYTQVNLVEDPGTFAVRGSIIDVFWPGMAKPVRIDLFGDNVDTIKTFDPQSQRAQETLEELSFGPAREIRLTEETCRFAKARLRELADEVEFPTKKLRELLDDLDNRIPFFGIEGLLPAFFETLETPLELLARSLGHDGFTVVLDDRAAVLESIESLRHDYADHWRSALARGSLCFAPAVFIPEADVLDRGLARSTVVQADTLVLESDAADERIELRAPSTGTLRQEILGETMRRDTEGAHDARTLLAPLAKLLRDHRSRGRVCLLPVASLGGVERLRELLRPHGLEIRQLKDPPSLFDADAVRALKDPSVHAYAFVARPVAPAHGAELVHAGVTVVAEDEIFGKRARRGTASVGKRKGFKTTLADLEVNDYVVHVEHGVGVYRGLTRLNLRGVEQDFILLTYANDDKLYLPVHRINLIQRYAGPDGKAPRVDKLGGTGWQTTRSKVKKAVLAMAQELLHIYAKRELAKRDPYPAPDEQYWEFEAAFPFETTPDQQKAIDDALSDMQGPRPMDRLVCGDVGYGKTEVGMRAAMLAVEAGRQVAVLAPTTVLAQQHYLTFQERFSATGAIVEVISRFRSAAEVKDVLTRSKEGKVDVLIGTHRLLSNDVGFKDLGLVVVDEEQRFGVKAKEKLKKLRASVDMLTLTATPIPRTLQMGFFGIRDLSVIETAPVDRRAIRTSISRFDDEVIREAIMRELGRGGQVYFVHNRVRSIAALADYLKRLVPEARIGIGHGQMDEEELEDVMLKFIKHEINVFVCTTIIETGIDVPSANTMFIDNADDFGLAQLYQLRGRVGRSKERAFAYLLIKGDLEHLTPDARKRLEVLQRFSELGAGFKVAQHDLELRGAGDLLGQGQHGHATAVGYDMYAELLKEAVEELKGRAHDDVPDPDINLPVAALIPDKFISDVHERLSIYQRLATAADAQEIYDVVGEVADRYGDPPAEVTALADVMVLKQRLRLMAARALELGAPVGGKDAPEDAPPRIVVTLSDAPRLDVAKLAELATKDPSHLKLTPQGKIVYIPDEREWQSAGREVIPMCRVALTYLLDKAKAA